MVDMSTLVNLLLTIFILMLAGYLLTKWNIMPKSARKPLTDLVINFILPCNIIVSFLIEFNSRILIDSFTILMVSVGIQLVSFLVGLVAYPGVERKQHASLRYATSVSNAGFIGLPIVQGLYGLTGAMFASIFLVPQRIVMWSAGVSCFTGTSGKGVLKKVLTHPCVDAVVIGSVLMVTQLQLPTALLMPIRQASNATTALTMLIIGNILADVDLRTLFSPLILRLCAIRLLILPLLILLVCRLLGLDPLVTATATILTGMPAAATTAILSEKYECDSAFGVRVVCSSTLLSLVTVPLLCIIMTYV